MRKSAVNVLIAALIVTAVSGALGRAGDDVQAAPIPPEAAVKKDKVKPLTVTYYNFGKVRPPGVAGIDSMQIARDFVNTNKPTVSVEIASGLVDCPAGTERIMAPNGKALGEFLFGLEEMNQKRKQAEAEGKAVAEELEIKMSSRNIFVFTGFIKVDKAGTYDFRVPCDDAVEVKIADVVLLSTEAAGMYDALHEPYLARAEFVEAGIYPVEILLYDKAGNVGIEAYSTVTPKGPAREVGDARELHLLQFLKKE